jgi:hypothetical protein
MVKKREVNLSNGISYLILISIFVVVVLGIGVYAMTTGSAPNPGHVLDTVSAPSGCGIDTLLKWTGSDWACIPSPPTCAGTNQVLHWDGSAWSCVTVDIGFECNWNGWSPECPCTITDDNTFICGYDIHNNPVHPSLITQEYCVGGIITNTQSVYCCAQVGGICAAV